MIQGFLYQGQWFNSIHKVYPSIKMKNPDHLDMCVCIIAFAGGYLLQNIVRFPTGNREIIEDGNIL